MITYNTTAFIENKAFGAVEVFLNDRGEIVFDTDDERFLLVMTKEEWEEIKGFIDKKFLENEAQ